MSKSLCAGFRGLAVLSLLLTFIVTLQPAWAAAPQFNDPGFENTWNRTDKPVDATSTAGRGYTWGPVAPGATGITAATCTSPKVPTSESKNSILRVNSCSSGT